VPDGDSALDATLRALAGPKTRAVAVAIVDTEQDPNARFAFIDSDRDTRFEIGSITKGLTGMLVADAAARGELTLDTTVGDLCPHLGGTEFWSVTLRELCTHTSGLPRVASGPLFRAREIMSGLRGRDPYRATTGSALLLLASRQHLQHRANQVYSNLGAAVAGQLAAVAAGSDYESMVHERILRPIGMDASRVGSRVEHAPGGYSVRGRREQSWTMGGYAPAGAVVSTIADMSRLAVAMLDGTAPGLRSVAPLKGIDTGDPNRAPGMFWIIDSRPAAGRTLIWHNGQTGGYSAFFAVLPELHRAVVVLANVADAAEQQRIASGLMAGSGG
jgi:CubicO group peptidase (beta-lactamase class C family)